MPLGSTDEVDKQVGMHLHLPPSLMLVQILLFHESYDSLWAHDRSIIEVTGCNFPLSAESELLIPQTCSQTAKFGGSLKSTLAPSIINSFFKGLLV